MAGDADKPRHDAATPADAGVTGDAPQALSQADLLAGPGLRGALFAQWGRQKRRNALQQRYGEEADALADDGSDSAFEEWRD